MLTSIGILAHISTENTGSTWTVTKRIENVLNTIKQRFIEGIANSGSGD